MKRLTLKCILVFALLINTSLAESNAVFKGHPILKISEGGTERKIEEIPSAKAPALACVISEINGKYFWASRDNIEMTSTQSGSFRTFTAKNGSGYVRVLLSEERQQASIVGGAETTYHYVEHLLIGLRSVTYYGLQSN
jgi:hypothetical protein